MWQRVAEVVVAILIIAGFLFFPYSRVKITQVVPSGTYTTITFQRSNGEVATTRMANSRYVLKSPNLEPFVFPPIKPPAIKLSAFSQVEFCVVVALWILLTVVSIIWLIYKYRERSHTSTSSDKYVLPPPVERKYELPPPVEKFELPPRAAEKVRKVVKRKSSKKSKGKGKK